MLLRASVAGAGGGCGRENNRFCNLIFVMRLRADYELGFRTNEKKFTLRFRMRLGMAAVEVGKCRINLRRLWCGCSAASMTRPLFSFLADK